MQKSLKQEKLCEKLCHPTLISAIRHSTRGLHSLRSGVLLIVTNKHTEGHCDSMTQSDHSADSVKQGIGAPQILCYAKN